MTMDTGPHWQAKEVDWASIINTDGDEDDHLNAVGVSRIKEGTRKRLYEHAEDEVEDREMDKLYKRDYWEDPAYAPLLERSSLGLARAEAVLCFSDRVLRATDAKLAQRRQERERRRSSSCKADESEPEPELEPAARAAPAATAGNGRLFLCFWRSIVDKLAALLH